MTVLRPALGSTVYDAAHVAHTGLIWLALAALLAYGLWLAIGDYDR